MLKTCPKCERKWEKLTDLLRDPHVTYCGYQKDKDNALESLALFTHQDGICGTTFSLKTQALNDLFLKDQVADSSILIKNLLYCFEQKQKNHP